eukprot:5397903-Ditylum_brightwellii.AAC.1
MQQKASKPLKCGIEEGPMALGTTFGGRKMLQIPCYYFYYNCPEFLRTTADSFDLSATTQQQQHDKRAER